MAMLYQKLSGAVTPLARRGMVAHRLLVSAPPARHHVYRSVYATSAPANGASAPEQPKPVTNGSDRVYTSFYVYKTRAAMCVSLVPPTFTDVAEGGKALQRDGALLLEFANANPSAPGSSGSQSAGAINRTYNWTNKLLFALSPLELGNILAGDWVDKGLTLYHDPAKLGKAGEPMKKLTIRRMDDGNLSFNLSASPDSISVVVSKGEFEVFKSLAQYSIPRLLGFSALFSS